MAIYSIKTLVFQFRPNASEASDHLRFFLKMAKTAVHLYQQLENHININIDNL